MELHVVWNRIDQLEKLVISQAKEIETLRRLVTSTQLALQTLTSQFWPTNSNTTNNNNNNNAIGFYHQNQRASYNRPAPLGIEHQQQQQQQHHHHHQYLNHDSTTPMASNRNSMHLTSCAMPDGSANPRQGYSMRSFVHPPSAIPPGAANNRALISPTPPASEHMLKPHQTHTLPAGSTNRWSTGPNMALGNSIAAISASGSPQPDRDVSMAAARRRRRFSVIELLTCFCPCFSMC